VANTRGHSAEAAKAAAATAAKAGHPVHVTSPRPRRPGGHLHHALAVGFSRGRGVGRDHGDRLIVVLAFIRVTRADLAGAQTQLSSPSGTR